MIRIAFTYSTVDEDSAAYGDYADHGFYDRGGWRYSLNNPETSADIDKNPDDYRRPWRPGMLREAIQEAIDLGINQDQGRWFSSEAEQDMRTGEYTEYSLHIDGVTSATYRRIARLLGA